MYWIHSRNEVLGFIPVYGDDGVAHRTFAVKYLALELMFKEIAANWDSESIGTIYGLLSLVCCLVQWTATIISGQRTWGTEVGTRLCCTNRIRQMSKLAVSDWISEYGGDDLEGY
jgi:hypothetical protein